MNIIKIRLKSLDFRLLDQACEKIVMITQRGSTTVGPVILPNEIKNEIKLHKRLIEIREPTFEILNKLMQIKISSGVEFELKQYTKPKVQVKR